MFEPRTFKISVPQDRHIGPPWSLLWTHGLVGVELENEWFNPDRVLPVLVKGKPCAVPVEWLKEMSDKKAKIAKGLSDLISKELKDSPYESMSRMLFLFLKNENNETITGCKFHDGNILLEKCFSIITK